MNTNFKIEIKIPAQITLNSSVKQLEIQFGRRRAQQQDKRSRDSPHQTSIDDLWGAKIKKSKMSDLSDEDPPELVSTDEEDSLEFAPATPSKKKKPVFGPEIPGVLKRDPEVAEDLKMYICKDKHWRMVADRVRILILDPFLFGTDNPVKNHNHDWIAASSKKFDFPCSKENIMHTVLDHEHLLAVELLENACAEVKDYLVERKLDVLKMFEICDTIQKKYKGNKLIEVDSDEKVVIEICKRVSSCLFSISDAKFPVLYVLKTWSFFANQKFRLGMDVTEEVDKENKKGSGESNRLRGNEKFKAGKFDLAIRHYKKAIEENPHCYVYYGNRAQAYLRLKKFLEAASDGRRAVSLKPDWIKGLYRYAEALYELSFYDEARAINNRASLVLDQGGENAKDRDKVLKQKERIRMMETEDKENKVDKSIKHDKKDENSKTKKSVENARPAQEIKMPKRKTIEIESDDDISLPELASAESSSDGEEVPILDRNEETKLADELKRGKPRDVNEYRRHQELMEKSKRGEKVAVENKKKKEEKRREKIQEETIIKEKEKVQEMAEANKKVEPELKKKGPLKVGTCANPVKLQRSNRVNGTDALTSMKKKDTEKLKNLRGMGSQALLSMRSRNAVDLFVEAMEFIRSKNLTYFNLEKVDVMVLKYAHGVALVESGTLQRILEGISAFEALLKDYPKQSFPLSYYGLGKGYVKQNRYQEAISHLERGLAIVRKNVNVVVYTWPGSSTIIEETAPGKMKEAFDSMLTTCRHPPRPDAVCFFADCHGFYKKEIYFSDPDFQGFVRTICYANCMVDFHTTCWKKFRTVTEDRHSEKDYLERPCFTPDCYACIIKVLIYDNDGLTKKEHTSEVDHRHKPTNNKKRVKQELANVLKIKRKEDKKALKKQRKLEERERNESEPGDDILEQLERQQDERQREDSASVTTEEVDSRSHTSHTTSGGVKEEDPLPEEKDMTVLKKEQTAEEKYKVVTSKKPKKKKKDKDRNKVTITLGEFNGPEPHEDDDDYDPDNPFSVPSQLRPEIEAFENSHFVTGSGDSSVALTPAEEDMAGNLYSFFVDQLEMTGPIYLQDPKLAELMEVFPPEANDVILKYKSLSNFLLQNLKFAMIDEHLCLLKDTVKAKKLADARMSKGTKYQSYSQSVGEPMTQSVGLPPWMIQSASGTILNPAALEFSPSGTSVTSNNSERTRYGDLCDIELPPPPVRPGSATPVGGKTKQRKFSEEEFPSLGDVKTNVQISSDNVSQNSQSDSLSSSCDDLKGNIDSKGGNHFPGRPKGGTMDVPPFLSGPPGAAKKKLPPKPRSDSAEKIPPFLSGPPLARNVSGSSSPRMSSPKPASPKRASPRPPEVRERKPSIADEFKRKVFEKLQQEKIDSEESSSARGQDLDERYQSDSDNSLDDLDGVDDVVVTATDTQKLDGEDYDANLDTDMNKTFEKAVGNERSMQKTIFDLAPGVSRDPSLYSWNVKEMNSARGDGNDLNDVPRSGNASDEFLEKMKLAKEAWNSPGSVPDQNNEFCSFPSVHSGPGFGGLPIKISPSRAFSKHSDMSSARKFSGNAGLDDIDDGDIFSELNADRNSKHSDSFTSDINTSMEREMDKMDEDFVHEFSSSVMDGLRSHSAFADDSSLADFVRETIQKDLQRCAVSKALNSAIGTHLGSNSGRASINQDILRKPVILRRSIAVQSEPSFGCVNHAVQTDPYEPYKLERDALQQQLMENAHNLAQAKNVCNSQRLHYAELRDNFEEAQRKFVTMNNEHERETLTLKNECHNSQEEIKRIKEQLHQFQAQEQGLIVRLNEQQQIINDVTQQKQEESERMTAERNLHINVIRQLEVNVQQHVATARNAEVELLEFKLDIGIQLMEKHMKDADHYFTNLQTVVKKYEDVKLQIPPPLVKSIEQWQKTKDEIQETANNCTQSFQEQIQKVKEGVALASLPKLELPRAPPPPDPLPPQLLRPPMGNHLRPGQNQGGPVPGMCPPGQQQGLPRQMSPTEHSNSPSPTPTGQPFLPRPQGPVPQMLPPFAQMPKQPPGMVGSHPGGKPQGPVQAGSQHQAPAQQAQASSRPETPQNMFSAPLKPTATVNPTGAYASAAKTTIEDAPAKMPPGFRGPSAGPPGLGLPSQPPLGGPLGKIPGSTKKPAAPKNSFEKIMVNLAVMFPNYKRQQLMGFVQKLRSVRSGSLTGMTLDEIIGEVATMILETNPGVVPSVQLGQTSGSGLAGYHDSGSSSPSSGLSGNQTPISNLEDEDPCVICHEEMTLGNFVSLDCHHIFHDDCIRKWLQEQRTCPTCRKYALLADEFPSLG